MPGKMRYPRQWEWPNGCKIAMSVNLALEAFRFKSQYTQEGRPGRVDHFSLSYAEYGAKAGIWRVLDFLDEVGLKGSMSTNGKAAQLYPEACRAVADAGHELVGHGWENDVLTDEDNPDAERDEIRRVTKAITDASGARPVGWTSPGSAGSANTLNFLAAEGYFWNGDEGNDDLPYVKTTANGPMVLLPRVNMPHNDLSIWIQGKNPPGVIWDQFKDTFDELYSEGKRGSPKWIEIVLHAHMAGRPTLIPTLRRCIAYAKQHQDVWFAKKRELAEWTLQRHKTNAG
jgi:peptidoglycan/xylan/chitin deacetylase (PgdA/CDA1 family)